MIAYRLTRSKYANDLAGTGGVHAGGRCNYIGTPVIYAAEHPSLALAEVLTHLPFDQVPLDYVLVTIEVPDSVPTQRATPEEALATSQNPVVPVYLVPSVIVPQELNVVMFPQAAGFAATVKHVEPFHIDERLLYRISAEELQSRSKKNDLTLSHKIAFQQLERNTNTSYFESKKSDLMLSRKLVLQQLERSDSERYSELLRRTLASLDRQIEELG
ncbi:MAG: RES family NAD+ phosphorylase [Candidatus Korobacteraceae bacterium]